ncbi:extracellular solute-binding protein family 3 [Methylobacterium radiotolerans JCM 2831]|uniref:Extracellular solute-binding protein family 3 n=2 Tax=Methylobacterium radiotolerans TaxID=31998 RepID=B1M1A4_METRJ|nr:extracellular solute-binding protein family 3 [Methylobacterium radiotolerans JCM 2831]GEM99684.1 ABC transporter substrate-binding protein [Methylobacterium radiotolerans]
MRIRAAVLLPLLRLLPTAAHAEPRPMTPDPTVLHDLAPTGTLRAAINLGNPVLAQGGADGPAGVSVDLARALAARLGVPVAFVIFPGAGAVSGSAGSGTWDICFLAIDPKRAEGIAFTEPYVLIAGSYLVPAASPIRSPEAVDRDGVRVSVGRGSAYDLFLSRALTRATLVRAPTSAEAVTAFARDGLDVAAGVHQPLAAYAAAHPEVRLLPGHFMEIPQAMGLPVGHPAGAAYLADFVARAKRDGLVRRGLEASGQDPDLAAP